jgi:hypothetical protein
MSQILGKEVGPVGLGLMGLTWKATLCPQEQAFEVMRTALKNGSTLFFSYSLTLLYSTRNFKLATCVM